MYSNERSTSYLHIQTNKIIRKELIANMRDPNRLEEFYSELKEIHKRTFSDWRFFQFMINFLGWVMYEKKNDGFYYEEQKALWQCNDKIAELNSERFNTMDLCATLTPALLSYDGIQYTYMAPAVFEVVVSYFPLT